MDNTEDEAMTRFFGFTQDDLRTRVPVARIIQEEMGR